MNAEELFRRLAALPSPSWEEKAISGFIRETMGNYGYKHVEDSNGNMLFFLDSSGPKLLLSAHMDTVAKAVSPVLRETVDTFMTDGTTALGADDKCALAALLAAAEKSPDVLFLFTVAEEQGLAGSALLTREFFARFRIKAAFIFDIEGDIGKAAVSAPGKTSIRIVFHGKAAHAGFEPENGRSALLAAASAAVSLPTGRIDAETTANIGSMASDGSTNVVPDRAEMHMEVRSLSKERMSMLTEEIASIARQEARRHGCHADIDAEILYLPYSISDDAVSMRLAAEATRMIGRRLAAAPTFGGSDANNLRALGIDAIVLSAGYEAPHSTSERIRKTELGALKAQIDALCSLR